MESDQLYSSDEDSEKIDIIVPSVVIPIKDVKFNLAAKQYRPITHQTTPPTQVPSIFNTSQDVFFRACKIYNRYRIQLCETIKTLPSNNFLFMVIGFNPYFYFSFVYPKTNILIEMPKIFDFTPYGLFDNSFNNLNETQLKTVAMAFILKKKSLKAKIAKGLLLNFKDCHINEIPKEVKFTGLDIKELEPSNVPIVLIDCSILKPNISISTKQPVATFKNIIKLTNIQGIKVKSDSKSKIKFKTRTKTPDKYNNQKSKIRAIKKINELNITKENSDPE